MWAWTQEILATSLAGRIGGYDGAWSGRQMIVFHRDAANFPWRSHALWLLAQMVRWGQVRQPFDLRAVAERVFRPDLYRSAVAAIETDVPQILGRSGPDGGGALRRSDTFDPADIRRPTSRASAIHALRRRARLRLRRQRLDARCSASRLPQCPGCEWAAKLAHSPPETRNPGIFM